MRLRTLVISSLLIAAVPVAVYGHGDAAPQPVDTSGLPALPADCCNINPYRSDAKLHDIAVEIGSRGYNSNCARCHGLEVKSGGMAPDLRELGEEMTDDAWFITRVRTGAAINGRQKMPPFEGLLSQEAIWAIRTYIDAQPQ